MMLIGICINNIHCLKELPILIGLIIRGSSITCKFTRVLFNSDKCIYLSYNCHLLVLVLFYYADYTEVFLTCELLYYQISSSKLVLQSVIYFYVVGDLNPPWHPVIVGTGSFAYPMAILG